MSMSIDRFLATATGPFRLRAELHLKTEHVTTLSKSLDGLSKVRTAIPKTMFGGDLVALLSNRLQVALLLTEEPLLSLQTPPPTRSQLSAVSGATTDPTNAPFRPLPELEKVANHLDSTATPPREQKQAWPPPVSTPTAPKMDIAAASLNQADRSWPELNESMHQGQDVVGPVPQPLTPQPRRRSPSAESVLARKLGEYWQLSRTEPTLKREAIHSSGGTEATARKYTASFTAPPGPQRSAPWPEMIGRQAAQKLQRATTQSSAGSARQVKQTINSNLPEKVEIQNVFNMEVKTEGGPGEGSSTDLADTLADILREQALQHGIDIT